MQIDATMPGVAGEREIEAEHDFGALYAAESDRLYRTLVAFTGGRGDIAEEAGAEAFARAIAYDGHLHDPIAWIYTVAFRLALDELRRDRKRAVAIETSVMPPEVSDVVGALRQLTPNQRAAIVLRYVLDLDVDEVAHRMGVATATVRVHLFRARRRLRELLGEQEDRV